MQFQIARVQDFEVSQNLSHGRKNRVKGFRRPTRMRLVLPEGKKLKVQYLYKGGPMSVYLVKDTAATTRKVSRNGQQARPAQSRPAAPRALGGMLGNLTVIEAENRLRVHRQQQGA